MQLLFFCFFFSLLASAHTAAPAEPVWRWAGGPPAAAVRPCCLHLCLARKRYCCELLLHNPPARPPAPLLLPPAPQGLRTVAYSMLAELVVGARAEMSFPQLQKAVHIFTR